MARCSRCNSQYSGSHQCGINRVDILLRAVLATITFLAQVWSRSPFGCLWLVLGAASSLSGADLLVAGHFGGLLLVILGLALMAMGAVMGGSLERPDSFLSISFGVAGWLWQRNPAAFSLVVGGGITACYGLVRIIAAPRNGWLFHDPIQWVLTGGATGYAVFVFGAGLFLAGLALAGKAKAQSPRAESRAPLEPNPPPAAAMRAPRDPAPSTIERESCPACGQANEEARDTCWACYAPLQNLAEAERGEPIAFKAAPGTEAAPADNAGADSGKRLAGLLGLFAAALALAVWFAKPSARRPAPDPDPAPAPSTALEDDGIDRASRHPEGLKKLSSFHLNVVLPELKAGLDDPDEGVRRTACFELAVYRPHDAQARREAVEAATPCMLALAQDPALRERALERLAGMELSAEAGVPLWRPLLLSEDGAMRVLAARGLKKMGRAAAPAVQDLIGAAKSGRSEAVTAVGALGGLGPDGAPAVEALVSLVDSGGMIGGYDMRTNAIYALRDLRGCGVDVSAAIPLLTRIAERGRIPRNCYGRRQMRICPSESEKAALAALAALGR